MAKAGSKSGTGATCNYGTRISLETRAPRWGALVGDTPQQGALTKAIGRSNLQTGRTNPLRGSLYGVIEAI